MHCLFRLRAAIDCAYEQQYHRKLRGRFDQALRGTKYGELHDTDRAAYTFSEILPYEPVYEAGEDVHLLVSSPIPGVLKTIVTDFQDQPRLEAGSFIFDVRAATPITPDVGPPGSSGTITTASGIFQKLRSGQDTESGNAEFWTDRQHEIDDFKMGFNRSVSYACEKEFGLKPPSEDVFKSYHLIKCYAVKVQITPTHQHTIIASKWNFGYEVRDEHHREILNAILSSGVGSRRPYGFGCLQTTHRAGIDEPDVVTAMEASG